MVTRVLMVGGTGLVGGLVLNRLVRRGDIALESVVRRGSAPRERIVDFEALVVDPLSIGGSEVDAASSCLGTTLRRARSPEAFRRVDHDYVVAFARAAKHRGAKRFILVSSVGAAGAGLYLRVKGDVESAVRALGFDRLDILRPSLLLGSRAERRPAERVAQALTPLVAPVMIGPLARYAPLKADVVAAAIEHLTTTSPKGSYVHHASEIRALARLAETAAYKTPAH